MTRDELIAIWRARVFDTEQPFLWSDAEGIEFLRDAQDEAADRARLLRDSTTAAVCQIPVVAGVATYALHASVLAVTRAKLDGQVAPLELTSTAAMDGSPGPRYPANNARIVGDPGWIEISGSNWEQMTGPPRWALVDAEGGGWSLRLVPKPTANDTLRLVVFRLPLGTLGAATDQPEIAPRLHIRLVDWMEHRSYLKKDSETYDQKKADAAAVAFEAAFGKRIDANQRRQQEDRAPCVVAFREF